MARTRYIKPEFFLDVTLSELPVATRYLYAGLWPHMDRNGVCEASPKLIKAWVFPYDDDHSSATVLQQLQHLCTLERLQVADFDGKRYIRCRKFSHHQWFHKDERPILKIPEENWRSTWDPLEHTSVPLEHNRTSQSVIVTVTGTGTGTGTDPALKTKPEIAIVQPGSGPQTDIGMIPASASPSPVALIGRAWKAAYQEQYDRPCENWGARNNGQAKNLLKDWTLERILELIPLFFRWPNPQVIRAGHPFGVGMHSFAMRIHELDADEHSPSRHEDAAIIGAQRREANTRVIENYELGESRNGIQSLKKQG